VLPLFYSRHQANKGITGKTGLLDCIRPAYTFSYKYRREYHQGKSASSKNDFIKYYEIALKSANETKYWLGLLRDALDADKTGVNTLMKETSELAKILAASALTMKGKNKI